MIRKTVKAIDVRTGEQVDHVRLTPENDDDLRELDRLKEAGLLDDRHSFADDPSAWE